MFRLGVPGRARTAPSRGPRIPASPPRPLRGLAPGARRSSGLADAQGCFPVESPEHTGQQAPLTLAGAGQSAGWQVSTKQVTCPSWRGEHRAVSPGSCPGYARPAGLASWGGSGVKGRLTLLHSGHPAPSGGSPPIPRPRAVSPLHSLALGAPGITSLHVDQVAYGGAEWQGCVQTRDARPLLCPPRGTDPSPAGSQLHPEAPLGQGHPRPAPEAPTACSICSLGDREPPLLARVDTPVLSRGSGVPINLYVRFWGESPGSRGKREGTPQLRAPIPGACPGAHSRGIHRWCRDPAPTQPRPRTSCRLHPHSLCRAETRVSLSAAKQTPGRSDAAQRPLPLRHLR